MEGPIYRLEHVVRAKSEDLEDFVGPLDLILYLLGKNRMEIKDIQISLILSQYLDWMKQRKKLDLEVASEFITMASHLVYIKARMLLSLDDDEARSEMEQLIASLEEHRSHENYVKIKSVTVELGERYQYGSNYIMKTPEPQNFNKTYRYVHNREDLKRSMKGILERIGKKLPPPMAVFEGIVGREPYPVADKASEILQRLRQFGVSRFHTLFRGNQSRSEIVATFIAVLELCKARKVRLAGTEEDCTVTYTQESEAQSEEYGSSFGE